MVKLNFGIIFKCQPQWWQSISDCPCVLMSLFYHNSDQLPREYFVACQKYQHMYNSLSCQNSNPWPRGFNPQKLVQFWRREVKSSPALCSTLSSTQPGKGSFLASDGDRQSLAHRFIMPFSSNLCVLEKCSLGGKPLFGKIVWLWFWCNKLAIQSKAA